MLWLIAEAKAEGGASGGIGAAAKWWWLPVLGMVPRGKDEV